MRCEQGISPSCGVFKEKPNTATGTTCRGAREIEGFTILEAWRAEARATTKSICRVGTARKEGIWGRKPWVFTGLRCRAQQDGRGFHGCGCMSVSYLGA